MVGFDIEKELPDLIAKNKNNEDVIITDLDKFLAQNNFYNTPIEKHFREYKTQSGFATSIFYSQKLLGVLAIHYLNKKGKFIEEEIQLVKALADQIGIAINQARLYKSEKEAKEKMSSSIIEIMRKSLDKTMIKKLFVKNIRKFFKADRVFLSEYDAEKKRYLPADKDSEYLSNYGEKSFVQYAWNNPEELEYIEPLLNKEELIIYNWDEYIKQNKKSPGFIKLFEDAGVKSSYNFPILHYQNIMGLLCMEFTTEVVRLTEEELNIIRNICTQVGIALYQAKLYLEAQQCFFSKEQLLEKVSEKIEPPLKTILQEVSHLSENNTVREEQVNNIIDNCSLIMNSTKEVSQEI
ncbi:MAG TPA: GAF domain-containing protein [Candidatus Gastranaerophilaceae bacterium]|nr:GAF domain-containing protein [Candidatus Gastranaerophilaceae bacterium]HPT41035.1 GAF domain-containing protein [Candidatus Gastranaerophilaceae bacterium]